ncbi:MAG: DMT family transporter [Pseudomonadota bacterium]
MNITNFLLALALGASFAIYLPMLAWSSRILGSPILGNVPFFGLAFLTSIGLALLTTDVKAGWAAAAEVPKWLWLAGFVSAFMILGASYLTPRIGTAALFVLMVAGQIAVGAVINQFGLLGVPEQPISWIKFTGILVVIVGAVLVSFGDDLVGSFEQD